MTQVVQASFDFRRQITDDAIQAAVDHANVTHIDWSGQAFDFLKGYAEINPRFMTEDVRNASSGLVPTPPSARAWGGVVRRAVKAGIIYQSGTDRVKNVRAHGANAAVWISAIVKGIDNRKTLS